MFTAWNKKNPALASWSLLILLSIVWGSSFILIKKGLIAFTPAEVAGIRILSASLFLFPVAFKNLRYIKKRQWYYLFISGFFGSLIPAFLFPLAQTRIDSGITGILNALTPLFTILLGAFFFQVRFNLRIITGILTGFLGSVALVLANGSDQTMNINFFAMFIILATIFYGLNVNILKYYLSDIKPIHIASISMFLVGPFAFLYLILFSDVRSHLMNNESGFLSLIYIIILGVMGTAIAMALFNKLIKNTNTVFASSVTYLIPIVAVIWGIVDGETLFFQHYFGMAAIIIGVLIANKGRNR
ncbi:MAG: EamA family transporter [Cyclobacteriaceae bacterium]|nr:EamA family transporter [Cyclobacteriaceae bacterium]